ncbi:protoporphyrinogen oxidase [Kineothrix alysoides]|uniref:Protoporphyrinogen oxidase n=1 Tax=Kineothrix alysoides TaxID=1469948 RepID=A0A4V2QC87_9FIRM|nr:NAD(P)/FAD-dependent oxidoreductase [Kineothrix alysoides]TCL59317.1 protoporphyrinogen oxidase [Kineothrix alysoides]
MKKVLIIGAGPAGLTAAYELLTNKQADDHGNNEFEVVIFEESSAFGGISRTVNHNGNRMDMGGHRFFSKVPEVNRWWESMLPEQGNPSYDDILLSRSMPLAESGPDPEKEDRVMLNRNRVSRIYFNRKFFDYPISLKFETIKNMGFITTIIVGFSYLKALVYKRKENSLEDFYINRFGRKLYSMFFENYTENLWGRNPSEIAPDWGSQRVKGLSIIAIIKDVFSKMLPGKERRKVETSLIEQFKYPKLGPGQLWEVTAEEIIKLGGKILKNSEVTSLTKDETGRITALTYTHDGITSTMEGDIFISSMPVKDLVGGMNDVPENIAAVASGLPYRDYMTLGVLVPKLNLKNLTKMRTVGDIVPDCWIYVHDRTVDMGRLQIYNNWSPYMIKDLEHTIWVGLEYFCNEGDRFWSMTDEQFSEYAIAEMIKIQLIDSASEVLDTHVERVKKAYPAYFDTYKDIDKLIDYLNTIDNLYCVGRNGQHRYNNIDHSMCTSFEAVKNIKNGIKDKRNIWNVNTEKEYHEDAKTNEIE